ncbi:MAG TPA: hypothetical protein VLY23_13375 [Candidatus Acidoferrum sp.]|nr:hypothetical protein [Candidatus Acidoferrum sp.]
MTAMWKGLLLGALQIALVLSLGGKLLYDRVTRPRVWVLAEVYDPELPIRGRYLSERLRFPAEGFGYKEPSQPNSTDWYVNQNWAYLQVRDNQLIATAKGPGPGEWVHIRRNNDGSIVALSEEPVLLFVSDNANVPALKRGEEMWVEVTIPAQGPPRPIRAGIKENGVLTPLKLD